MLEKSWFRLVNSKQLEVRKDKLQNSSTAGSPSFLCVPWTSSRNLAAAQLGWILIQMI